MLGTLKLSRLAAEYHVKKFVLISTDKAVNPTNIMGASKRLCEMVIQMMNRQTGTDFVAVRLEMCSEVTEVLSRYLRSR